MELTAGQIFADDFRVERELGRGGMGAVYLVTQLSTDKPRALKLMAEGLLMDAKAAERFLQEAKVGARVASEHVVEVIAAGVERNGDRPVPWLVMELLEGESLAEAVERGGPMPPARAQEILRQLCHGLGAAHRAGLVHRDVKPDNIFLAESKAAGAHLKVKLLDFGIAKILQPTVDGQGSATAPMGTPLFMAPEQTRAGSVDARADVWALGLVAYYVLTGRHYWKAANEPMVPLTALLVEISVDVIDPASARAASQGARVPDGFDAWFLRCVSRELDERYPNADVAYRALSGTLSGDALAATVDQETLEKAIPPTRELTTTAPRDAGAATEPEPAVPVATEPEPHVPVAPAASPASRTPYMVAGAGALMLAIGAGAVGWASRGGDTPTPLPTPPVGSALDAGVAMAPLTPDAGAPPDAGFDAGVDAGAPEPESPGRPRPPPLSLEDQRIRSRFITAAQTQCRSMVASMNRSRVMVRVTIEIAPTGVADSIRTNPRQFIRCLGSGAGSLRWSRGARRTIRMRFPVEYTTR